LFIIGHIIKLDFWKDEIQKSGGNIMNLLLKQNNKAYCSSRFENHRFALLSLKDIYSIEELINTI